MSRLRAAFIQAWSLPCPNTLKQTLWILAINGIPGSNNPSWYCPHCHSQFRSLHNRVNATLHYLWECPVAKAVRDEINRVLAAWSSSHTRTSMRSWKRLPPLLLSGTLFGLLFAWPRWRRWSIAVRVPGAYTATPLPILLPGPRRTLPPSFDSRATSWTWPTP